MRRCPDVSAGSGASIAAAVAARGDRIRLGSELDRFCPRTRKRIRELGASQFGRLRFLGDAAAAAESAVLDALAALVMTP